MGLDRCWISCLLLATIALASCSEATSERSPAELSGSATAEGDASGRVVVRQPSPEEFSSVRNLRAEIDYIDAEYSRSPVPTLNAPLYRVRSVKTDGQIALQDGNVVRMDGVDCSEEGIGYISRLLLADDVRVAFRPIRPDSTGATPAEVWMVDVSYLRSGAHSPSYSLLAETALVSGWCVPDKTSSGVRHERYRALAALARTKAPEKTDTGR